MNALCVNKAILGLSLYFLLLLWVPTRASLGSNEGVSNRRRLAQNRQTDVYHCSNPDMVNFIESDIFCNPNTFQWNLTLLEANSPPGVCFGVNYTRIYEDSLTQNGLSDLEKPCYWWNLLYGSMAPSSSPSTGAPSLSPSYRPSKSPSLAPTMAPTTLTPSSLPTLIPSQLPSLIPSQLPSLIPSQLPSDFPTTLPTRLPSIAPSSVPSAIASAVPSGVPSTIPSAVPLTLSPSSQPSAKPYISLTSRPSSRFFSAPPTSKPTKKPTKRPTLRPSIFETTYSPTLTAFPTQLDSTGSPTLASTVDRTGTLVRPLANFVIAFYVGVNGTAAASTHGGLLRRRERGRQRQLLSENHPQLTSLTSTYLIERLKLDFPNSHVRTVILVLSAQSPVGNNATTNTSTSSSTFREALSGEVIFGTNETSLVPLLSDLYASIQKSFTDPQSLKIYFKRLHSSKDAVLKRITRVDLIQGATSINTTAEESSPTNNTSSLNSSNNSKHGVKWSVGLIAIVAGSIVATLCVALLVCLCITSKSRKRRRRLRKLRREQEKNALTATGAQGKSPRGARIPPPPAVDATTPGAKTAAASNNSRRWFSWGSGRSAPDLTLQPTESTNSSPLSLITTPRSRSKSPVKRGLRGGAAVAQSKRRNLNEFDLVSDDGHGDFYKSAADEDRSEVTSTYSYIEANTNDEHSISVAQSFLYGANETGSIMGDHDDFGELVGNATKSNLSTSWINNLNVPGKNTPWVTAGSSRMGLKPPLPKKLSTSAVDTSKNRPEPPTAKASQEADDSHVLNISGSYGSFYEFDEKKGIMIVSRPPEDAIIMDDEMPSKIGGSFLMEDSFLTLEESQSDGNGVFGDNRQLSILESPSRVPGMDSGSGSLFLNSPSTSISTNSPRKGSVASRMQQPLTSVDDKGIGEVLQFYEGTTSATSITPTPSPVKATKKFAFGEVWRDIVEEEVDDHVRETTSSVAAINQLNHNDGSLQQSLKSTRLQKVEDNADDDYSPKRLARSDASLRMAVTPTGSRRALQVGTLAGKTDFYDTTADEEENHGSQITFSSSLAKVPEITPTDPNATATMDNRQGVATRRWLANQANSQRTGDLKQSRSRSVAPPSIGERQRPVSEDSGVTKRGSSLPPPRHSSLHRAREDLPFDEEVKYSSLRHQRIDEAGDDGGVKFSI